jgi:phospholipid/cholesterol/gamma-HCH transport system substrate-binding protein
VHVVSLLTKCLRSGKLDSKACKKLLGTAKGLTKLRKACRKPKNEKTTLCVLVNQIPGPPNGAPTELPSELTTILPDLGGLGGALGLGRAAVGPDRWPDGRGPTLRQLTRLFDPDLVRLLAPGMVTR